GRDYACFLFDMPKLRNGRYKVSLLLFDRNKRIVGENSPDPFYKGDFEWVKNKVGLNDVVWEPFTPMAAKGAAFETLKHRFTVDASGLPAQIFIKPHLRELPLEQRAEPDSVPDAGLIEIGRGPQLRSPLRLEAVVNGRRTPARVVAPAKLTRQWKSELQYASRLKAGPLDVEMDVQYDCDGAMTVRMTYGSDRPVEIDGLEMVGEVAGLVDMVASAAHGGGMAGADKWECTLPAGEGVVWDSTGIEHAQLFYTHFIPWLTFGSGDRAFSWIADSDEHWLIDRDGSTMALERNQAGEVTWRVRFVNHKTTVSGRRTIEFMLLTHPAKAKPKGYRRIGYFQRGDVYGFVGWGPKFGTDQQISAPWRRASGAPTDLPESARATYAKLDPPWNRWYQLRGSMPAIPAVATNALSGDLYGRMRVVPTENRVKRIIDGKEQWTTVQSGGGAATMGRAWQDLFAWHFGRLIRLGRYHGWWWDETWPTYRSSNLAAGEAYLRDPADVGEKELPWQDQYLTMPMRGMFKRLARVFAESGVPNRNAFWATASAGAFESFGYDCTLVEACSSDHNSFELDNVVVYPNSLFKYHSHNYTGMIAMLVPRDSWPNSIISRPGDDKRLDRQLLGRALLNDIGIQWEGPHGRYQHREQCIRLINALIDFGYFETDDRTEMIPYWRNRRLVRYGEEFRADGAFELTKANPYEKVYVTVYRRPLLDRSGKRVTGSKAMFVIMNESDEPVRERLFVLDPKRIFGGPNRITGAQTIREYDFSKIEKIDKNSDWRAPRVSRLANYPSLLDLEDRGVVKAAGTKGREGEIYGPVYIGPHDYRILYGYGTR
ncbi:MAG TPA: glycoside hydrolase domain-containing protein, partial [Phycisphaerae bacterium]|nr:glycoside hydrolase domain-containing protein [Phycisphaerae bacterium]